MTNVEVAVSDQDIIDILAREYEEEEEEKMKSTQKESDSAISLAKLLAYLEDDQIISDEGGPTVSSRINHQPFFKNTTPPMKNKRPIKSGETPGTIAERIGCKVTSQSKGLIKVWTKDKKGSPDSQA